MFISRRAYQDTQNELITLREEAKAQITANRMLEATHNWFRHRLTQIESERAQLIHHILGVKIAAPRFEEVADVNEGKKLLDGFHEMNIFQGMSDEDALKQGVELDASGYLKN